MCNEVHRDDTYMPIPESGVGWKLFAKNLDRRVSPFCSDMDGYKRPVEWDDTHSWKDSGEFGFCFFQDKLDDSVHEYIAHAFWGYGFSKNVVLSYPLLKISYHKGLGSHIEQHFILFDEYRIALCKGFDLHEDEKAKGYHF